MICIFNIFRPKTIIKYKQVETDRPVTMFFGMYSEFLNQMYYRWYEYTTECTMDNNIGVGSTLCGRCKHHLKTITKENIVICKYKQ